MKIAPYLAKKKLDAAVSEVSCISWLFANDPMSDFSRNRKLSVESLFRLMLKFSGKSLQSEISSYYDPKDCSQRSQEPGLTTRNNQFDILNRIYVDCVIDPGMHMRERSALIDMVNRLDNPSGTIILADRGYEGYNSLAHMIEHEINFLIRAKDLDSNGFLQTLHLPAKGEFDINVDKLLTFSLSRKSKGDDSYVKVYRGHFDFLEASDTYPIHFRLVRIKLSDNAYECLVTNLPRDKFPPKKLKRLYSLRWGIENAYRDLKYTVDLLHFHGKSSQAVLQEVFCSLTMFNFCAYLCVHADILHGRNDTKYRYKVNFANAVGPCRAYLHSSIDETALLDRLKLAPTPIRPDRHIPRPSRLKEQSSREFNYRAP